ncbi:thioredoxin family protein [Methylobacterium planeticum]|uniref:Thioredoxin family protein n=1 Tax=Methylobacterium planeticum TaxID=2615211 RepID=A0A6N6MTQ0_9HYPH|nr:thioredoxin family protein [Methylobacterium planeticum]KAB1074007.1 thioredoxin family protein [Methylobacterium planeticum]
MIGRRRFLRFPVAALLAAGLVAVGLAAPAAAQPFDPETFEAAQAAGKPVLVVVSAPWCPICRTQKPILAKLGADPRFKDLVLLEIDFDTQKPLLRRFDARQQSTLIAYKGRQEVGRSVGETQPEWIESLVEKTL